MIVLFTDFGLAGPYTGQLNAVLQQTAPGVPIISLFADLPAGEPKPNHWYGPVPSGPLNSRSNRSRSSAVTGRSVISSDIGRLLILSATGLDPA